MLVTLYKLSEVYFRLLGTNVFHAGKGREGKIYLFGVAFSSEPQF